MDLPWARHLGAYCDTCRELRVAAVTAEQSQIAEDDLINGMRSLPLAAQQECYAFLIEHEDMGHDVRLALIDSATMPTD